MEYILQVGIVDSTGKTVRYTSVCLPDFEESTVKAMAQVAAGLLVDNMTGE